MWTRFELILSPNKQETLKDIGLEQTIIKHLTYVNDIKEPDNLQKIKCKTHQGRGNWIGQLDHETGE